MRKFVYIVSYHWSSGAMQFGFGNLEIITNKAISTVEDVREIEKQVKEINPGNKQVVLLNYMLLRVDGDE